jgi:hypothetical protein
LAGASEDSIKSLCTDRDGVMIGFIVSEVNSELEEKMHERQKVMQELVSTAKAMSNTFGDPMLEFDLLIDQLDTKPSAIQVRNFPQLLHVACEIRLFDLDPCCNCDCCRVDAFFDRFVCILAQVCSKFIIRHQSLHERIREKLCETIDTLQTSKGKSNIIYVVHDVIKSVRAGFPQNERNAKMRESPLVTSLGKVLYTLVQKLPEDARHCVSTAYRLCMYFYAYCAFMTAI